MLEIWINRIRWIIRIELFSFSVILNGFLLMGKECILVMKQKKNWLNMRIDYKNNKKINKNNYKIYRVK